MGPACMCTTMLKVFGRLGRSRGCGTEVPGIAGLGGPKLLDDLDDVHLRSLYFKALSTSVHISAQSL